MERHRIDMWLKLVCLFKHRADATEACKGGLVKLNGTRVKPSAAVKKDDLIEFYQGDRFRRVIVQELPESNVSKEAARTMYVDESPVPQKVDVPIIRDRGAGRPTKKERREIEKWRR
ncbi:MAG TPA: S4 domain-containing protein [Thermoanaerobaculia bacterium]|nr:S4 domain-containing protein [Thermoanaerobaculia bacterium]